MEVTLLWWLYAGLSRRHAASPAAGSTNYWISTTTKCQPNTGNGSRYNVVVYLHLNLSDKYINYFGSCI